MEFLAGLHSKIIHFPIAFLIVYPFVELTALISKKEFVLKFAQMTLIIGVLGAVGAVLTGNQAFLNNPNLSAESLEIFYEHESNANFTIWIFTALLIFRYYLTIKKKLTLKLHLSIVIIALMGIFFIYQTGSLGGELAKNKIHDSSIENINTYTE